MSCCTGMRLLISPLLSMSTRPLTCHADPSAFNKKAESCYECYITAPVLGTSLHQHRATLMHSASSPSCAHPPLPPSPSPSVLLPLLCHYASSLPLPQPQSVTPSTCMPVDAVLNAGSPISCPQQRASALINACLLQRARSCRAVLSSGSQRRLLCAGAARCAWLKSATHVTPCPALCLTTGKLGQHVRGWQRSRSRYG